MLTFEYNEKHSANGFSISILKLHGAIDGSTVIALEEKVMDIQNSSRDLILDFDDVTYINSTGMGLLIKVEDKYKAQERSLILINVTEKVIKLFELLNITSCLKIYETEEQALESIQEKRKKGLHEPTILEGYKECEENQSLHEPTILEGYKECEENQSLHEPTILEEPKVGWGPINSIPKYISLGSIIFKERNVKEDLEFSVPLIFGKEIGYIALKGYLTIRYIYNFSEFIDYLKDQKRIKNLFIDFKDIKVVDSSGLNFLIQITKSFRIILGDVVILRPTKYMSSIIEIMGLKSFFSIKSASLEELEEFMGETVDSEIPPIPTNLADSIEYLEIKDFFSQEMKAEELDREEKIELLDQISSATTKENLCKASLTSLEKMSPSVISEEILFNTQIHLGRIQDESLKKSLVLTNKSISNRHAVIIYDDEKRKYLITDIGSTNGTYVNGEKIEESYLKSDDIIKIGDLSFKFRQYELSIKSSITTLSPRTEKIQQQEYLIDSGIFEGTEEELKFLRKLVRLINRAQEITALEIDVNDLIETFLDLLYDLFYERHTNLNIIVILGKQEHPISTKHKGKTICISSQILNDCYKKKKGIKACTQMITGGCEEEPIYINCLPIFLSGGEIFLNELSLLLTSKSKKELSEENLGIYKAKFTSLPDEGATEQVGVIYTESSNEFNQYEIMVLNTLSHQLAIKAHNLLFFHQYLRVLDVQKDLETAKVIQTRFLPHIHPEIDNIQIAVEYIPQIEVGGDYYDFILTEDKDLYIVVCDVEGHGVKAALIMTTVRAYFRTTLKNCKNLKEIVLEIADLLYDDLDGKSLVTFQILKIEKDTNSFSWIGAPLIFYDHLNKDIKCVQTNGITLGIKERNYYESEIVENTLPLNNQDIIVLYTDGVVEACQANNDDMEQYGVERLLDCIKKKKVLSSLSIKNSICEEIQNFIQNGEYSDDFTLIVIKKDIQTDIKDKYLATQRIQKDSIKTQRIKLVNIRGETKKN